jgi:hypothetical protein
MKQTIPLPDSPRKSWCDGCSRAEWLRSSFRTCGFLSTTSRPAKLVIGRGTQNDIVIPRRGSQHAVIFGGEHLEIEDLASRNGTRTTVGR